MWLNPLHECHVKLYNYTNICKTVPRNNDCILYKLMAHLLFVPLHEYQRIDFTIMSDPPLFEADCCLCHCMNINALISLSCLISTPFWGWLLFVPLHEYWFHYHVWSTPFWGWAGTFMGWLSLACMYLVSPLIQHMHVSLNKYNSSA